MIELRWLVRQLPDLPGAKLFNRGTQRTLQYRQQREYLSDIDPALRWDSWKDVPMVSAQETALTEIGTPDLSIPTHHASLKDSD